MLPEAIENAPYNKKKFAADSLINFDPRPRELSSEEKRQRIDKFHFNLQIACTNSSWEKILRFKYEDYELDRERVQVLLSLCHQFIDGC